MPRSTLPPRGVEIPTMLLYSEISPAVIKTWGQLRGLAWGKDTTPPVDMPYLVSLTGKTQSALYEHMRILRDTHALRWQMAGTSTFIFSFPSNDEINSCFQEHATSLINSELSVEEEKREDANYIPEKTNKTGRKRATKATVPAEALKPIIHALSDVTAIDERMNYSSLAKVAKMLYLAEYTAEQVRQAYGDGGRWWKDDWRGRKKERPDIWVIPKTIKGLLNGCVPDPIPDPSGKTIHELAAERMGKTYEPPPF